MNCMLLQIPTGGSMQDMLDQVLSDWIWPAFIIALIVTVLGAIILIVHHALAEEGRVSRKDSITSIAWIVAIIGAVLIVLEGILKMLYSFNIIGH